MELMMPLPQLPRTHNQVIPILPPQDKPGIFPQKLFQRALHLRTQAQKITEHLTENRRIR